MGSQSEPKLAWSSCALQPIASGLDFASANHEKAQIPVLFEILVRVFFWVPGTFSHQGVTVRTILLELDRLMCCVRFPNLYRTHSNAALNPETRLT